VAQMQNNYGLIRLRAGDIDAAERYLERSLELCRALRMDCDSVLALSALARIGLERKDQEAAMSRAGEAMELGRSALLGAQAVEKPATNGKRNSYVQGVTMARHALARALAIGGAVFT